MIPKSFFNELEKMAVSPEFARQALHAAKQRAAMKIVAGTKSPAKRAIKFYNPFSKLKKLQYSIDDWERYGMGMDRERVVKSIRQLQKKYPKPALAVS